MRSTSRSADPAPALGGGGGVSRRGRRVGWRTAGMGGHHCSAHPPAHAVGLQAPRKPHSAGGCRPKSGAPAPAQPHPPRMLPRRRLPPPPGRPPPPPAVPPPPPAPPHSRPRAQHPLPPPAAAWQAMARRRWPLLAQPRVVLPRRRRQRRQRPACCWRPQQLLQLQLRLRLPLVWLLGRVRLPAGWRAPGWAGRAGPRRRRAGPGPQTPASQAGEGAWALGRGGEAVWMGVGVWREGGGAPQRQGG